jgi:hypothetical protein
LVGFFKHFLIFFKWEHGSTWVHGSTGLVFSLATAWNPILLLLARPKEEPLTTDLIRHIKLLRWAKTLEHLLDILLKEVSHKIQVDISNECTAAMFILEKTGGGSCCWMIRRGSQSRRQTRSKKTIYVSIWRLCRNWSNHHADACDYSSTSNSVKTKSELKLINSPTRPRMRKDS